MPVRFLFILPLLLALEAFADQPLQPWLDTALPGSVLRLPAGTYRGPGVIDKPLTLEGSGKVVSRRRPERRTPSLFTGLGRCFGRSSSSSIKTSTHTFAIRAYSRRIGRGGSRVPSS